MTTARARHLVSGCAVFLALLFAVFIYRPSRAELNEARRKIAEQTIRLVEKQALAGELPEINKETVDLREAAAALAAQTPADPQLGAFLNEVSRMVDAHSLRSESFAPDNPQDLGLVRALPIEITFCGSFDSTYRFIADLERIARTARIRELTIRSVEDGTRRRIETDMKVAVFFQPLGQP